MKEAMYLHEESKNYNQFCLIPTLVLFTISYILLLYFQFKMKGFIFIKGHKKENILTDLHYQVKHEKMFHDWTLKCI